MMDIKYHECSWFIKHKLKINLLPYQEVMLKAMCDGLEIRSARCIGRSFVADAFGKYVASIAGANNYEKKPDVVFPYTCAIESGIITEERVAHIKQEFKPEVFEREMLCR